MSEPWWGQWATLRELPCGAVFQTQERGILAVKSEYHYPNGGCQCVLLASGEYAHFNQGPGDPPHHNATLVRELDVTALLAEVRLLRSLLGDAAGLDGAPVGHLERYRKALARICDIDVSPSTLAVAAQLMAGVAKNALKEDA